MQETPQVDLEGHAVCATSLRFICVHFRSLPHRPVPTSERLEWNRIRRDDSARCCVDPCKNEVGVMIFQAFRDLTNYETPPRRIRAKQSSFEPSFNS